MKDPRFIHLRLHTDYSMIDGLANPYQCIRKAYNLKMAALGITDVNNLFGVLKFYKYAHQFGIKPILGIDFNIKSNIVQDKLNKITLLASTYEGYKNLILLSTAAHKNRILKKEIFIKQNWLAKCNKGLIVLSGGCYSDIGFCLLNKNLELAYEHTKFYLKYFPNSFYLEVFRTNCMHEEKYLTNVLQLAVIQEIPVVATNEVCFLEKKDLKAHKIRIAINKGLSLYDVNLSYKHTKHHYLRSEEEMCELFQDIPQVLENSVEIAKRCNVFFSAKQYFLPQFKTGSLTTDDFLISKAQIGLKNRLRNIYPDQYNNINFRLKYQNRLNLELTVINKMGFSGYFLIVMEFIQWAKKENIAVGPGRGSGAGSLVAYVLQITEIDPIAFDLLFERFLNPERISLPDFDIDFCMEKRDQVIEHVSNLYGKTAVSQIITFGRMTAKAVIRDVGRVLGYPYNFVNRISKLIPMNPGITLNKAFIIEVELETLYNKDAGVRLLIDTAKKLEGVIRNVGKHAGGVIIVPGKVIDFCPLYFDEDGKNSVTQFDKDDIETIGLVKFDFLGLRTLTVIQKTVNMINKKLLNYKKNLVDINNISLTDKNIFKELKKSNTTAIFQLESIGIKELIKRLQPDSFEDLLALLALFRPGPLQSGMVDNFINRKHGKELIYYPDKKWEHKLLQPILESTYGIILYQEQVMKIAQVLSGYTLGSADILRRAMTKKDITEMEKQRCIFQTGAKNKGINDKLSVKIFNLLQKFAGYGFNKSHSAAYALISYQTFWLKFYYPAEFMSVVMSAEMDNTEKLVIFVEECFRMNLKIIPPSINKSMYCFKPDGKNFIVYGMGAIKGLGRAAIDSIINSRNKEGIFKNLFDLCMRINLKKLNRRMIEKLITSGACDCFQENRSTLFNSVADVIKSVMQYTTICANKKQDLFGDLLHELIRLKNIKVSNIREWSQSIKLAHEKNALGFYLTAHPIDSYVRELEYYTKGLRLKNCAFRHFDNKIIIFGLVIAIKTVLTKNKEKMIILTIDDKSSRLEVIVFCDLYDRNINLIEKDKILIIKGRLICDQFTTKSRLVANYIIDIETQRKNCLEKIVINVASNSISNRFFNNLERLLHKFEKGPIPIYVYYKTLRVHSMLRLGNEWKVFPSNELLIELKFLVKPEQVILKFKKGNHE